MYIQFQRPPITEVAPGGLTGSPPVGAVLPPFSLALSLLHSFEVFCLEPMQYESLKCTPFSLLSVFLC